MPTTTLSNEEILEAIGNKSVLELADLIEAFKTKFNVTIAAGPVGGAGGGAARLDCSTSAGTTAVVVVTGTAAGGASGAGAAAPAGPGTSGATLSESSPASSGIFPPCNG